MYLFLMTSMLFLIVGLYLFLSPRDTFSELKLIFDPRVIRRGMRFRLPRRLPRLKLPSFRFSIFTVLVITAVTAIFLGFMQLQQVPLAMAIATGIVLLICAAFVVLVACNTQGRGVLRQQRENYLPSTLDPKKSMPTIKIDTAEPRRATKTFSETSFPKLDRQTEH